MSTSSPPWGPTVKLVVGLTMVTIIAALLVRFRTLVGPLLLAIILAYLLHPAVSFISRKTRMPWRTSVNLIYLVFVIVLIGLITATGVAAVQQTQSLFRLVNRFVTDLPQLVEDVSSSVYLIGPFELDMQQVLGQYDLERLLNQVLGIVQPMLGQAGGLIGSIASGTLSTLGWLFFILLVSYFTLLDAGQFPDMLSGLMNRVKVPGYQEDISRLGRSLNRIWNAFMRGQLTLFLVTVIVAFFLMTVLGVRNALALALVAGFARFVPYLGPFITWLTTGVVAFLQPANYLGLEPLNYALLIVGVVVVWDQVIDNLVTPRLYGQALNVHPAAVLVAAIIAANLLGLVGLLLAAPVLATLLLFGRYALRKMVDLDPWPDEEEETPRSAGLPGTQFVKKTADRLRGVFQKLKRKQDEQADP